MRLCPLRLGAVLKRDANRFDSFVCVNFESKPFHSLDVVLVVFALASFFSTTDRLNLKSVWVQTIHGRRRNLSLNQNYFIAKIFFIIDLFSAKRINFFGDIDQTYRS